MMYRICLVIGFIVVVTVIALHQRALREIIRVKIDRKKPAATEWTLVRIIVMLVYLATFLCFLVLIMTGFYPSLFAGKALSGYSLMLHATASPVFAVCMVATTLLLAQRNRFDEKDWDHLQMRFTWKSLDENAISSSATVIWRKVFFWLMIFLTLPVIISIALSMFPIFGTEGQKFLYHSHRYSTLLLVMCGSLFGYLSLMSPRRFKI